MDGLSEGRGSGVLVRLVCCKRSNRVPKEHYGHLRRLRLPSLGIQRSRPFPGRCSPREEGQRMLHKAIDPADDGNAVARAWHAVARAWHAVRPVLIAVGVGLGVFAAWVAAALLLYRLLF
jgi:hypothetical protein